MTARPPIRFNFESPRASADELRVTAFHGTEAISELFQFEIDLASEIGAIELDEMVGRPGRLIFLDEEGERWIHGIVTRFEVVGRGARQFRYRARLVPNAWMLKLHRQSRIFQNLTTPDILREVFENSGLSREDFRIDTRAAYLQREYCVQYRESDWNFAARLMEADGIFYYFENAADRTVLVLADRPTAHPTISGEAAVPHRQPGMGTGEREEVWRLRLAQQVRHGAVTLRDFDFTRPSQLLEEHEEDMRREARGETRLEYYDYPGDWVQQADGTDLARVRLEELRARRLVARGETNVARLLPGHKFTLADHPYESSDQEYVAIAVKHWGSQEQAAGDEARGETGTVYHNTFEAIPADVVFRPTRRTGLPRIDGPQTAIVVGPSGEEIHTDEHARVKVQFHWDRAGQHNERSSCWIRVSQVWSGAGWGALQIPRMGQEVVVDFLEGDPDRPLIIGRVYNGENPPPYALPGEKTKSTIKSDSSLGGGGSNELRFEDAKGSEEVYLHAEKNWNIVVENDKTQRIGHDESSRVGHDRSRQVGHDEQVRIGHDRNKSIANDEMISIGKTRTTRIEENEMLTIAQNRETRVGVNEKLAIGGQVQITIGGNQAIDISGEASETIGKKATQDVAGDMSATVGGDHALQVAKDQTLSISGKADWKISKDWKTTSGKKVKLTAGDELTLECGSATIIMKKSGDITIKGKKITIEGSGNVTVKGTKIAQN